jgi:acetyl esterase
MNTRGESVNATRDDELDAQIVEARRRQAAAVLPVDFTQLAPDQGRALANSAALYFNDGLPDVEAVHDLSVPNATGMLRARLYRPSTGPIGAALFLHGGGWFHCNVDTHDRLMRVLARDSGLAVLGVDYRLAPEHPHPAGLNDAVSAWRWLREHAGDLNINEERLSIAGDSAGANIALAMTLAERNAGRRLPRALALLYGCYDTDFDTASHRANGNGQYGLTTARMRWYWENYVGPGLDDPPPSAAPLRADLSRLSPIYLALAALDPLADDTRRLAAKLAEAKVPHVLKEWANTGHAFMQMTRDVEIARRAASEAAQYLARYT